MKGVVFTIDSFFALVIAVMSISLLTYFFYYPEIVQTTGYSEAFSTMQTLLSTNSSSIAASNPLFYSMAYQSGSKNEVWDQFMRDFMHNGGNAHGPLKPSISFIFKAAYPISTGIVADYGKVFFAAGKTLYAVNATTGSLVWTKNAITTVNSTPIIASGLLVYANTTNITAINPNTNSLIWETGFPSSANQITSPMVAYSGKLYFGATTASGSDFVLAYYLNNGTSAWNYALPNAVQNLAIVAGSIAIVTANTVSGNTITLLNDFGNSAGVISTETFSVPLTGLSSYNNVLLFGSNCSANTIYTNGTHYTNFPYSMTTAVSAPTVFNGSFVYQSSSSVIDFAANGTRIWSFSVPSFLGANMVNASPIISSKLVYSLWSNNYLVAQNATNGRVVWSSSIPFNGLSAKMSLAYGRLYVTAGNKLIAYGTCNSQSSASILALASALYISSSGSCADALLNYVYPMSNYTIFVNNSFAPAMNLATFNAMNKSAVYLGSNSSIETNRFSWSLWMNTSSWAQGNAIIGEPCLNAGCPFMNETSNATAPQRLEFSYNNNDPSYTVFGKVSLGKWQHIVVTYSDINGGLTLYLNGVAVSSVSCPSCVPFRFVNPIYIGNFINGNYFNGNIANLQIYNSTLAANQVYQLYIGGIQGPTLSNAGLTAWYPLDGDANDYSGNSNTGYATNVIYLPSKYLPSRYTNSYQVSRASVVLPITNLTSGLNRIYSIGVVTWK